MCLAVPGKILSLTGDDPLFRTGRVSFGGIVREVSLAYTPQAKIDDYVIVHAGFAISKVDEEEAQKTLRYLQEIGELEELRAEETADGR
jgi:hydrogenase expression/formation protein HypC